MSQIRSCLSSPTVQNSGVVGLHAKPQSSFGACPLSSGLPSSCRLSPLVALNSNSSLPTNGSERTDKSQCLPQIRTLLLARKLLRVTLVPRMEVQAPSTSNNHRISLLCVRATSVGQLAVLYLRFQRESCRYSCATTRSVLTR